MTRILNYSSWRLPSAFLLLKSSFDELIGRLYEMRKIGAKRFTIKGF
jgi:hypothetical protein